MGIFSMMSSDSQAMGRVGEVITRTWQTAHKMKIQRAKDIICDGSMNLTEIAYFLSYSSLPYFSKQFRIATGMSPSAYASSVKGITDALRNSKERERDA